MPMTSARPWVHIVSGACALATLAACKERPSAPARVKVVEPAPKPVEKADSMMSGLRVEDCADPQNGVAAEPRSDTCSCAPATADTLAGMVSIRRNANDVVYGAAVLRVARHAAEHVRCELALETDTGWYVLPQVFACDAAPIAHDGDGVEVAVKRLAIDETNNGGNVVLRWQSSLEKPTRGESSCSYRSPGPASCSRGPTR